MSEGQTQQFFCTLLSSLLQDDVWNCCEYCNFVLDSLYLWCNQHGMHVRQKCSLYHGSYLVLWAQSTTKDYIRAEHKLQSVSQVTHSTSHRTSSLFFFSNHSSNSIYNFRAQNQKNNNMFWGNLHPAGWPILFCRPTQELVLAIAITGKTQVKFWKKMQLNGPKK